MTDYFNSELAFGVRWNDPAFAVRWPIKDAVVILARDDAYPDFNAAHRFDLAMIPTLFGDLQIVLAHETDDGKRVYATVIAQKAA